MNKFELTRTRQGASLDLFLQRAGGDNVILTLDSTKTGRHMAIMLSADELDDLVTALRFYQEGLDKNGL